MAEFNFESGPEKIYVSRFDGNLISSGIQMTFRSGEKQFVYMLDFALAKKIGKYLQQVITDIETKNGIKFEDRLDNEPIPSPLKMDPESK